MLQVGSKTYPRPIFWLPFQNRSEFRWMLWWLFPNNFFMICLWNGVIPTIPSPPRIPTWRPETGNNIIFKRIPQMDLWIFALMEARDEIPMATHTFSWSSIQVHLSMIPPHVTGSRKCKMATAKPEVLISKLVDMIVTKLQLLIPCFESLAIQRTKDNTVHCTT